MSETGICNLPLELLPRILPDPLTVAALALTCERFHQILSQKPLFVLRDNLLVASEYFTVDIFGYMINLYQYGTSIIVPNVFVGESFGDYKWCITISTKISRYIAHDHVFFPTNIIGKSGEHYSTIPLMPELSQIKYVIIANTYIGYYDMDSRDLPTVARECDKIYARAQK